MAVDMGARIDRSCCCEQMAAEMSINYGYSEDWVDLLLSLALSQADSFVTGVLALLLILGFRPNPEIESHFPTVHKDQWLTAGLEAFYAQWLSR